MKLKIALIGCGRISFKHIEAYVNNQNSLEMIAACDPVIERAHEKIADYTKEIPEANPNAFSDYKEMLVNEKPDIVTIATES